MLLAGIWNGHDSSYAVLDQNGDVLNHFEHERYSRIKESRTDSIQFLFDTFEGYEKIKYLSSVYPKTKTTSYIESWDKINKIINDNDGKIFFISHHLAHAANTYYSSNYDYATIITIDGGGVETEQGHDTACVIWLGNKNKIERLYTYSPTKLNIGGCWSRYLRGVFDMPNSSPHGGAHGTLMSHANYGDPNIYKNDFLKMMTDDLMPSSMKHSGQVDPWKKGQDSPHPYLYKWKLICQQSEQNMLDLAAGLQAATEVLFQKVVKYALEISPCKDTLCFSGGVSLNSVCMGKLFEWFPQLKHVYVCNTVSDAGLSIGSAQYVYHEVLGNQKKYYHYNLSPYQGRLSNEKEIKETLDLYSDRLTWKQVSDQDVIELLYNDNIISVFGGKDECGKRALGNRSILFSPLKAEMKKRINEKTKNRDNLRPFAPSILREEVKNWFKQDIESPYMSFVLDYKDEIRNKIPAVDHFGTGRLQTVRKQDNKWYYNFIKLWQQKTEVPILGNTSLNNQTPICSHPKDAIECYLSCDMDYLYFYDVGLLVERK